mgnify:CR=1 FL=1
MSKKKYHIGAVKMEKQDKNKLLCEYCQKNCFVYVNGVKIYCHVYKEKYVKLKGE